MSYPIDRDLIRSILMNDIPNQFSLSANEQIEHLNLTSIYNIHSEIS